MPFRNPDVLAPISGAVARLLDAYRVAAGNDELRKYFKRIIKHMCRELEYVIRPRVSEAAQQRAAELRLPNLTTVPWARRGILLNEENENEFHQEHLKPVKDLLEALLNLADPNPNNVEAVLCQAEIAWILKTENRALDARHDRECGHPHCGFDRCDPYVCYQRAGIALAPDVGYRTLSHLGHERGVGPSR
jgi:hypothetical protein